MAKVKKTSSNGNTKLGNNNPSKKKTAQGNSRNTKFKNKNKKRLMGK